jgi:hypothetical protein
MAKGVADIVVETLQAADVNHCWGVPGDTLNFVTDAIRRSDIEWVHVRHIDQVPDGVRLVSGVTATVEIDPKPTPPTQGAPRPWDLPPWMQGVPT